MSADLLERLSERGDARGPANVWAEAQSSAEPTAAGDSSHWIYGLVVATLALVALFGATTLLDGPDSEVTVDAAQDEVPAPARDEPLPLSEEPLPAPVLIEGMSLDRVQRPLDSRLDADDLFGSPALSNVVTTRFGTGQPVDRRVVFADPDDPWDNPIVGIEAFEGGGFRPWVVNAGEPQRSELIDAVERTNGDWTIDRDTGLRLVADFDHEAVNVLDHGWQFDFSSGNDQVTLQALAITNDPTLGEWAWLALQLSEDTATELSATTVLDTSAVLSTETFEDQLDEELFWACLLYTSDAADE